MPTKFYLEIQYFNLDSQSQKHSTQQWQVRLKSKFIFIRSPNQQQPIVPIQQSFQHSSQLECSPADVASSERRPNLWICVNFSEF